MLTIFSIPKAFKGHTGVIQRNAIGSWLRLEPKCEIFLLGDDEGTSEAAEELGVHHIPSVERNEYGTPLLSDAYRLAESKANGPMLCYVNADMILTQSLIEAVQSVTVKTDWFFMTARRRDLDVPEPLEFEDAWTENILERVKAEGSLGAISAIDFWVYPKGLLVDMPPLAVGRIAFECWCLYRARLLKADVIDATPFVVSIHQTHDYSHIPGGAVALGRGIEAQRNRELVGGRPHFFSLNDRTHILDSRGLRRVHDHWSIWRAFRTSPVLHPSMPLPVRLPAVMLNSALDSSIDMLKKVRNLRTPALAKQG